MALPREEPGCREGNLLTVPCQVGLLVLANEVEDLLAVSSQVGSVLPVTAPDRQNTLPGAGAVALRSRCGEHAQVV